MAGAIIYLKIIESLEDFIKNVCVVIKYVVVCCFLGNKVVYLWNKIVKFRRGNVKMFFFFVVVV